MYKIVTDFAHLHTAQVQLWKNVCNLHAGMVGRSLHINSLGQSKEVKTIESVIPFHTPAKGDNWGLSPFKLRPLYCSPLLGKLLMYRTRAIITRGLYTFYLLFEVHLCTMTFGLMYG